MTKEDLKNRTKKFSSDIIKFTGFLPSTRAANVICNQILRSATSVGANYRAACRTRSRADFISKITIVEEEADETLFWLELLLESGIINISENIKYLMSEANELVAIFVSSGKTAKLNYINNPKSKFRNPKSE
jgi:four helix bundle protein